jgi:hypothetical protein
MVRLSSGSDKLVVSGNGAVLSGAEVGISFAPGGPGLVAPCNFKNAGSGAPSPCAIAAPAAAGASMMLSVGDVPVLLDTAQGVTVNVPPATWSVGDAGQQVLAVSG